MSIYIQRGEIPPKRHTQFRRPDGSLYYEELLSRGGFSGIYSNLYHLRIPSRMERVGDFHPTEAKLLSDRHRHRHLRTARVRSGGDAISARRALFINDDVTIAKAHVSSDLPSFYRNGHADELIFTHSGSGILRTNLGDLAFRPGDYIVIPRGIILQMHVDEEVRQLVIISRGPIETPSRYRNSHGQLLESSPFCERDIRLPEFIAPSDLTGEYPVTVALEGGFQEYIYGQHPFDIVGWDGCFYPWIFNIGDFEPITGRIHQPPPLHQTFQAPGLVVCSFVPRLFDYHPESIPAPYYHSNVDSDEVIFYSRGNFMSRSGIEEESITLHPMGLPHGPQPGLYAGSIGEKGTDELAVMIDTFKPLKITEETVEIDDPDYPQSWL